MKPLTRYDHACFEEWGDFNSRMVEDELEASIAEANEYIAEANKYVSELKAERDAARAECERLRADAERYRWLLENCAHSYGMSIDSPAEHCIMWSWQQATQAERDWTLEQALDAAIDAARKEGG